MNEWLWFFGKVGVVLGIIFTFAPLMTLMERKVSAWVQMRHGPNRVGPQGLLQPVADLVKLVMKELIIPGKTDRALFFMGPVLAFIPPTLAFCVIPFGNQIGDQKLQVANLNIGILFLMAVLSTGVYGITLGGWASNNKYSLLGSLRASAQLISYELTLGLTILMVVMMAESVDPQVIVGKQTVGLLSWNVFGGGHWWALPAGLIGFVLMWTCALAENNRLPFDMAECDAELVGGYHTEYSSMGFALYMLSEYVAMVMMSALITTLFLGGWHFPFLTDPADTSWLGGIISVAVFCGKVAFNLFVYLWVRWTLPRFRYDQIMQLGWKSLLPVALCTLAYLAVGGVLFEG